MTPPAPPTTVTDQVSLLAEWNNNWSELWVRVHCAAAARAGASSQPDLAVLIRVVFAPCPFAVRQRRA